MALFAIVKKIAIFALRLALRPGKTSFSLFFDLSSMV
jgi:hypothetical protein